MSPGAGYDRGLFRGIARYAQHYGSWVFLPFWNSVECRKRCPWELDIQSSRLKCGRNRSKSMTHELKRLGVTGIIGRLVSPAIIEAIFALNLPAIGLDLTDETTRQ